MDMKKKKNNIESEDWKKMCGAQSSIPNYFNRSEEVEGIPEVTTKHMKVEDLKTSLGVNLLNEEQGKGVGISNLSSIEEKTEEKSATNLMEDFNTMQQMFATGMYNVCTAENNENQTSETPQDFNTMQSLFSTQGPKMTPHLVNQSKVTVSEDPQEFSTMQSLFKTNNVNMSKIPQQSMDPNQ